MRNAKNNPKAGDRFSNWGRTGEIEVLERFRYKNNPRFYEMVRFRSIRSGRVRTESLIYFRIMAKRAEVAL